MFPRNYEKDFAYISKHVSKHLLVECRLSLTQFGN